MVHCQAGLPEQLLDVAIAQGIAKIPGDRLQDERRLEVTTLEVVLGPTLQPLGNRTQDHEVPPNRRAKLTAMPDEPSTPQICDRPSASAVVSVVMLITPVRGYRPHAGCLIQPWCG